MSSNATPKSRFFIALIEVEKVKKIAIGKLEIMVEGLYDKHYVAQDVVHIWLTG
jgi:hypothetical protein